MNTYRVGEIMAKKKKKTAAKKSGGKSRVPLVIASKAKDYLKGKTTKDKKHFMVSAEALDGLNDVVYWYLDQAAARCDANGRVTIRKHDFMA